MGKKVGEHGEQTNAGPVETRTFYLDAQVNFRLLPPTSPYESADTCREISEDLTAISRKYSKKCVLAPCK